MSFVSAPSTFPKHEIVWVGGGVSVFSLQSQQYGYSIRNGVISPDNYAVYTTSSTPNSSYWFIAFVKSSSTEGKWCICTTAAVDSNGGPLPAPTWPLAGSTSTVTLTTQQEITTGGGGSEQSIGGYEYASLTPLDPINPWPFYVPNLVSFDIMNQYVYYYNTDLYYQQSVVEANPFLSQQAISQINAVKKSVAEMKMISVMQIKDADASAPHKMDPNQSGGV